MLAQQPFYYDPQPLHLLDNRSVLEHQVLLSLCSCSEIFSEYYGEYYGYYSIDDVIYSIDDVIYSVLIGTNLSGIQFRTQRI